jgi:sugar/nucleoside kinase (ribokinase family)
VSDRPETGARVTESGWGEPDVVIAGAACRDIAADDPRGWRLGGGVTYTALTSARLGLRTAAVIGLDPQAFDAHELALLAESGVELLRVRLPRAPVYLNVDSPAGRIQTCVEPGLPLPHVAVPAAWRAARAWILAPVAGELDGDWADPIPAGAFVALGWQGLLRTLRAGTLVTRRAPAPGRLVGRADLVGLSEHDVAPGTSLGELAALLHPGAWLAYTNGVAGGRLAEVTAVGVGRIVPYEAIAAAREVDATGAGDTFLAALVASVVQANLDAARGTAGERSASDLVDPIRESRFAAAAASFTVEAPGLDGVPDRAAVLRRLAGRADQSLPEPPSSST